MGALSLDPLADFDDVGGICSKAVESSTGVGGQDVHQREGARHAWKPGVNYVSNT